MRHVAVADHHRAMRGQVEGSWSTASGWPLYQATKRGGGVGAGPVLARDPEPVVVGRAERVDDRVVALQQVGARDVLAQRHPAEEAEARLGRGLVVDARDRLDLRVVGGHAGAHEPERRRERVEEVDLEARAEQLVATCRSPQGRRR